MCGSQWVEGLEEEILNLSCQVDIIDIVWGGAWCGQKKLILAAYSVECTMAVRSVGRLMG